MASVVCNCPQSTTVTFANGSFMQYDSPGSNGYCVDFKTGGPSLDIRPVYAPGEFGAGTQNFGGGELEHEMKVTYVSDSEVNCIDQFSADALNLSAGTFSMTVAGFISYAGCYLKSPPKAEQPRATGVGTSGATYRMDATFHIHCVRPYE